MGLVSMAEQTAPVRRVVALKVIKAGMGSRQVLAWFEAERQARMEQKKFAEAEAAMREAIRPDPARKFCQ